MARCYFDIARHLLTKSDEAIPVGGVEPDYCVRHVLRTSTSRVFAMVMLEADVALPGNFARVVFIFSIQ